MQDHRSIPSPSGSDLVQKINDQLTEREQSKSYIGTKVVRAIPMDSKQWKEFKKIPQNENEEVSGGYKVTYDDGYVSWSPKEVFERCYREITSQEKSLIRSY